MAAHDQTKYYCFHRAPAQTGKHHAPSRHRKNINPVHGPMSGVGVLSVGKGCGGEGGVICMFIAGGLSPGCALDISIMHIVS